MQRMGLPAVTAATGMLVPLATALPATAASVHYHTDLPIIGDLPVYFSHVAELIDRSRERAVHHLDRVGPGGVMRCRN